MTIDEAIEHAKEVARTCNDSQCAADHVQLAEWLRQARGADKAARWYTAKMRELKDDWEGEHDYADQMETIALKKTEENDKLRELVQGLWFAAQYLGMNPDGATGSGFAHQMRELGIEVGE